MITAWHMRQDGLAIPTDFHLYSIQDDNFASEAELASLIITTQSNDRELAEYILDA